LVLTQEAGRGLMRDVGPTPTIIEP
jgi:hypothetical protein